MSKILAVFGATGQQGSSVVDYVLNDPELSKTYKIRAITRDTTSEKALQLAKKVEVVQADASNKSSLETALAGAHTIFSMTTPSFVPNAYEIELSSAKTIADVAVSSGAQYLIFSTLPSVKEISGGKYTNVFPFDAKADAEKYIRTLPIKSAFYAPGSFMQNFTTQPFFAPRKQEDGTYVMSRAQAPDAKLPLVDVIGDTGKYIGAILANPEKYEGKTFCATARFYTFSEIAEIIAKAAGEKVVYKQVSEGEFKKQLGEKLPVPALVDMITEMYKFLEEFGYYGPEEEKLVAWGRENARGEVRGFEEFLVESPIVLE